MRRQWRADGSGVPGRQRYRTIIIGSRRLQRLAVNSAVSTDYIDVSHRCILKLHDAHLLVAYTGAPASKQ